MNNLNEAIKFIKDKLDKSDESTWPMCVHDFEHVLDLLLKAKQDVRDIQHKAYRLERDDD